MNEKRIKPELVSPAGGWSSLTAAVENGADSVYFGLKTLNMRNLATNFDLLELPKIMSYLHKNKKKGYLTLNTIVMDNEIDKLTKILKAAKKSKVDAVILWDMAALSLARKTGLKIHLSTQASVSNKEALAFFAKLGVKRIVLARECSLEDIKSIVSSIAKKGICCEIETFIHGAMCVSISGRCFLSQYSFAKSANRGKCLQPCRREYLITDKEKESTYLIGNNYVLSPKDLCAIEFLDDLIGAGIHAFKIEGRMKSAEYVKIVTSVYRQAIDAVLKKKYTQQLKEKLLKELSSVYNRGFSTGFYFGKPKDAVSNGLKHSRKKTFVGKVTKFFNKINVAEIEVLDHPLEIGDTLMFIGKHTAAQSTKVNQIEKDHKPQRKAVRGEKVGVKLPFKARVNDKVFLWQ